MATLETNTELGRQVVEDAKRYVLHSWSVQNALDPLPVDPVRDPRDLAAPLLRELIRNLGHLPPPSSRRQTSAS